MSNTEHRYTRYCQYCDSKYKGSKYSKTCPDCILKGRIEKNKKLSGLLKRTPPYFYVNKLVNRNI